MKTILIAFQSDTAFLLAQNKQAKIVANKDVSIYWQFQSLTQDGTIKAIHYSNALAAASNKKNTTAILDAYGRTFFNNN